MEEGGEYRSWDELLPDALGMIFSNLSLKEKLTLVPAVCKSWATIVKGPYCWQEIDILEWSSRSQPDQRYRMLEMLIFRSRGSLHKLCVSGLNCNSVFGSIADHAGSLQTLQLPRSGISEPIFEIFARKLSTITFLDISSCVKLGARSLEAIGKHCKFLVRLHRSMHPSEMMGKQEDEAHAIATTMPKLKHLEIAFLLINTSSALEIITSCRELEFLDLRGCWNVKLDENYVKETFPNLKILGPHVIDCYERNDYVEGCSDYSDSSGYYDDESSDEERLEELELRVFEGFEDGEYDWPPSP